MQAFDPADPLAPALPRLVASVGLRRAPASDWAGAIRNLKGISADEREWFDLEGWLGAMGRDPVSRETVMERLAALSPSLGVTEVPPEEWRHADRSPEGTDGYREILVILENNPRSTAEFKDHHWDDQPGLLMHLRLIGCGRFLKLAELQSEWHQRGARGLRVEDPRAFRDAAEARRVAAENEIDRLMREGQGAAFVREVSLILGSRGAQGGAYRIAWSSLNGNDCGPLVASALDAARPHLSQLTAAFTERWKACREIMSSLDAVPLAPMRASWARAGLRLAMALAGESHDGLVLASGDEVAEALGTDEALHSLSWRTLPDNRVEISPVTIDVNGSRAARPAEAVAPEALHEALGSGESAIDIRTRLAAGEASGELDGDWFAERQEVIWPNRGIRRFYDAHLPRLLAEEGKRAGAEVLDGGIGIRHTASSRAAWALPRISDWEPPVAEWESQAEDDAPRR